MSPPVTGITVAAGCSRWSSSADPRIRSSGTVGSRPLGRRANDGSSGRLTMLSPSCSSMPSTRLPWFRSSWAPPASAIAAPPDRDRQDAGGWTACVPVVGHDLAIVWRLDEWIRLSRHGSRIETLRPWCHRVAGAGCRSSADRRHSRRLGRATRSVGPADLIRSIKLFISPTPAATGM
jgi:hypothetical protein